MADSQIGARNIQDEPGASYRAGKQGSTPGIMKTGVYQSGIETNWKYCQEPKLAQLDIKINKVILDNNLKYKYPPVYITISKWLNK